MSRLELAEAVADTFGFDRGLVRAATQEEMDVRRLQNRLAAPFDCRLAVAQSEARLGRINLGLREGLESFRQQLGQARSGTTHLAGERG